MTKWAVCAAVTQEMLNDLVLFVVGEGVALDPVETDVAMPAMGDIRLKVALTITGGTFDLRADDGDRVRVVVTASGVVEASAAGYDGESAPASPMMPSGPVPIPVRVEAIVDPVVELADDLSMTVGLAVGGGELIGVTVDMDAPAPPDVDPDTWVPMTQMVNLLFASMGTQLWDAMGEHVGVVGTDVGADVGGILSALGVAAGRADVTVGAGLLTLGLPASDGVIGRAVPMPIEGARVGVSLAESGVHQLAAMLIPLAMGERPMPFDIHVDLGDQRVRGTVRQTRLLESLPDLRLALRTDLRPTLVGGRLEISLQAAWVELPSLFGGFGLTGAINNVSRAVGSLASLAPLRMGFPSVIQVPIGTARPDGTPDTIGIEVDDLRVTGDGIGVVVGLA